MLEQNEKTKYQPIIFFTCTSLIQLYDCGDREAIIIFFLLHLPIKIDVNRLVHVFTKFLNKYKDG